MMKEVFASAFTRWGKTVYLKVPFKLAQSEKFQEVFGKVEGVPVLMELRGDKVIVRKAEE